MFDPSLCIAIAESAFLVGLEAQPVRVEVHAERGIPFFELVGHAEAAVRESRVRVKSALATVGVDLSEARVIVNLAPADVRKRGTAFDLAIALSVLAALGVVPREALAGITFLGELSLAGRLHPIRGLIPHLVSARRAGVVRAIVPKANEDEAALVEGIEVAVADTLEEIVGYLRGDACLAAPKRRPTAPLTWSEDLRDVRGQVAARRALEVAAAGGHNLVLVGPPGSGKTMLARRLAGILPPLTPSEALDVMAIQSVAGTFRGRSPVCQRPFRAPHHTTSEVALVGGGERAIPGEVTLAHHGVLFLDELAEFRRGALEALRQPLEDGFVNVVRTHASATYPARPIVVGATNPCPCGYHGTAMGRCACGVRKRDAYRGRLSGPLLDRIDIHVALPPVGLAALQAAPGAVESSAVVRKRVVRAREMQNARFAQGEVGAPLNASLGPSDLDRICALDAKAASWLGQAMTQAGLSARSYTRILRVARTIADLEGRDAVGIEAVSEATGSRCLDRPIAA